MSTRFLTRSVALLAAILVGFSTSNLFAQRGGPPRGGGGGQCSGGTSGSTALPSFSSVSLNRTSTRSQQTAFMETQAIAMQQQIAAARLRAQQQQVARWQQREATMAVRLARAERSRQYRAERIAKSIAAREARDGGLTSGQGTRLVAHNREGI